MLTDKSLTEFTGALAADTPTPGGGSSAALQAAQGAALVTMVARLTLGREKYAEVFPVMEKAVAEGAVLLDELLSLVDRDTEAYDGFSAALALPKGTDGEKAARSAAMQAALKGATETPYAVMTAAFKALELAGRVAARFNLNAASDLGVAALGLVAAMRGAWLNVRINLGAIRDEAFRANYEAEGPAMLARAESLAADIMMAVEAAL